MPERGTRVDMPPAAKLAMKGLGYFTWPLKIDDYLALINPLWSTAELRGRIERIHHETDDAVTVYITPGFRWRGHKAGQYIRIGFDIEGKRHWRAYSLSSDGSRPDGQVTITVKRTQDGVVSNWLHGPQALGSLVTLGQVDGQFTLPDQVPERLLFLTAGSGVTPVMAMIRSLERSHTMPDTVHLHSAHTADEAIFASALSDASNADPAYRFVTRSTATDGRMTPADLDELCPDWRERHTFACGPGAMLDDLTEHFGGAGLDDRLQMESFERVLTSTTGEGGAITFTRSDARANCAGDQVILQAGEDAGVDMPFGCRIGICHTCTGMLSSGAVRDLRTGSVTKAGTEVRTCVNSPEGDVTIDL
ncbi:ferredoxin reductase [Gordonia liuliyuniae]|uniref:Ferredoxin reductase n=1 Tax=Gordonia liuliyuniae TaxID=2911517 RepID=A0ABS9IWP7_9ACTN|nr:ferredoxin reductase [Gordonia liuliyuniae]MCF8589997.1 ferredoxin reductase [Gordonia liuliyuniae]